MGMFIILKVLFISLVASGVWIYIVDCVQILLGDIVGVLGLTCQMVFVKDYFES